MSLVKCPECGREKVSSTAVACPECGFNIKEYYNKNPEKLYQNNDSVTYIDCYELQNISIFSNGLKDGAKGKEIVKHAQRPKTHDEYDYYVENKNLYITRRAGTVKYLIWNNCLLNTKGKLNGYIPNDNLFEATCSGGILNTTYQFMKNKTFTEKNDYGKSNGTYIRDGIFFAHRNNQDTPSSGSIIYKNELYLMGSYIKHGSEGRLKQLFQELDNLFPNAQPVVYSTTPIKEPTQNLPTCPICGSTNLTKLSNVGKAAKVGFFGIFGAGDLGKTWKCKNCGSKF